MMTTIIRNSVASIMVVVMCVSTASGVGAMPVNEQQVAYRVPVLEEELTSEQVDQAAEKAEQLFTELLRSTEAGWVVNEDAAQREGVPVEELESLARTLNQQRSKSRYSVKWAVNSVEYRRCVLNAIGLGALISAANSGGSQLGILIAAKNWKEVAWVLARLVGVNALKGGVAGAAAALAGAGAWCATPWAQ